VHQKTSPLIKTLIYRALEDLPMANQPFGQVAAATQPGQDGRPAAQPAGQPTRAGAVGPMALLPLRVLTLVSLVEHRAHPVSLKPNPIV